MGSDPGSELQEDGRLVTSLEGAVYLEPEGRELGGLEREGERAGW